MRCLNADRAHAAEGAARWLLSLIAALTVIGLHDAWAQGAPTELRDVRAGEKGQYREGAGDDKPTLAEADRIKRQLENCWYVDISGSRVEDEDLIVIVKAEYNRYGTLQGAYIVNSERFAKSPAFRAMAESVLRALTNPACSPLNLPPSKYDSWKEITFTFDARLMVKQ